MPRTDTSRTLRGARLPRLAAVLAAVGAATLALLAPPVASAAAAHNPIGYLDSAIVTTLDGSVTARGWTADGDGPTKALKVQIFDNKLLKATVLADDPRPDVAHAYPHFGPSHGYSVRVVLATGSHQICAVAFNIGGGVTTRLGCRTVSVNNSPSGKVETAQQSPGAVTVTGYAVDPNLATPVTVRLYVDGTYRTAVVASAARADLKTRYPTAGPNHGFSVTTPITVGTHSLCVYAPNLGLGTGTSALGCASVSRTANPTGGAARIARVGTSNSVAVSGWALDPDTKGAISVRLTSDGIAKQTIPANVSSPASAAAWPAYGGGHGYSATVVLDGKEHVLCLVAVNTGAGVDRSLGCVRILSSGGSLPAVPGALSAWPGSKAVTLNWTTPLSVAAPITRYQITVTPGNRLVTVAGSATSTVVTGLTNGVRYSFSVRAQTSLGVGSAAVASAAPSNIPPQFTPAPVSTSHYLRNPTGNLASDAALMRKMGAGDAGYNPSGHSYLVLLQIGGQDESRKGALLSATSRFVSYAGVVSAVRAYLDGYHTKQRSFAPVTVAVGTNNDVDVSSSAGASWARSVVSPIAGYAGSHYAGITVAGADDMEPGFSATVSQTRAWLSGYLASTSAKYVFNGSADGCSTATAASRCNNGWSMADLQWLSGGAAPTRTISLPQIYNYAMPQQWKWISVTGTHLGRARLYFGGPLTEVTACGQAGGSCGSISNVVAWKQLWAAISSSTATRQYDMPHGTDLRIN